MERFHANRPRRLFLLYSRCATALVSVIDDTFGRGNEAVAGIVEAVRATEGFPRIQRKPLADDRRGRLATWLYQAWAEELSLRRALGAEPHRRADAAIEVLRTGYWAPFASIQAFLVASGSGERARHRALCNSIATIVTQQPVVPEPWNTYVAPGVDRATRRSRYPAAIDASAYRRTPLDPLRTALLVAYFKERRRALAAGGSPIKVVTPLHLALCMRAQRDYRGVDLLVKGARASGHEAAEFYDAATSQVSAGMALVETLIAAHIGLTPYAAIMDAYLVDTADFRGSALGASDGVDALLARRDAICNGRYLVDG